MATQSQGDTNIVMRDAPFYDDAGYAQRQSVSLGTISGNGGVSTTKFSAFAPLILYGITFLPVTALGSSTYTVNGTVTNSVMSAYAVFVANTNTTGTVVGLYTTTVGGPSTGPFYFGGTAPAGTNVNLEMIPGLGGYARYALNTLGGTNTAQPWGTTTYFAGPVGAGQGAGGLYMNPGDVFYVVAGTDATGTASHILEYSLSNQATVIA